VNVNLPGLDAAVKGTSANGVPYIAAPPADPAGARGTIVLWHGADPPRSESALAAALPLSDLSCWRIYLGMPLYGGRLPAGGFGEIMQLAAQDAVNLIFKPSIQGAVDELPDALQDIRRHLSIEEALPLGLFGFSQGGAAALLTLCKGGLQFRAAATFGAVIDLRSLVDALAAMYGMPYEWRPDRVAVAESLTPAHRGEALASSGAALLMAVGAEDPYPLHGETEQLGSEVRAAGGTAEVRVIPGVPHAFVEQPGEAAAPQGPMARSVEQAVSDWFAQHLS
jgi:dienelactone hydrolase